MRQESRPFYALALVIAVVTFAAFYPALHGGFVSWDDWVLIYGNPNYRGLGAEQLKWMFRTHMMGNYSPLTWLSLGVDYSLWGMNPHGYHLTNNIIHIANSLLAYCLIIKLLEHVFDEAAKDWELYFAAAFGALFFAVHPLRVESVAWASERRDVLSGLFYLATVVAYLCAVAPEKTKHRAFIWMKLSVFSYTLSLFSKGIGVTLPAALVILDIYPLRRLPENPKQWLEPRWRAVWLEKIPFILLSVTIGGIGVLDQAQLGATVSWAQYGLAARVENALFGLGFYLWKTLLPTALTPIYEPSAFANHWSRLWLLSGALVSALSFVFFMVRRRFPGGLAAWIFYVATLLPVIGLTQFGPQVVADRYSYLSCLGWAVLAGAVVLWLLLRANTTAKRAAVLILPAAIIAVLSSLTRAQTRVWRDSVSLYRQVLKYDPDSRLARHNLAVALVNEPAETPEVSIEHFRESLQLNPQQPLAEYDLGIALASAGRQDEAIPHLNAALALNPKQPLAHFALGVIAQRQGRLAEAVQHYRQEIAVNPDYAPARANLAPLLGGH